MNIAAACSMFVFMSDLKRSEQLKIYLLRLSQCDCDADIKGYIKRLYRSSLPKKTKDTIYPLAKTLSYYYQHPNKDIPFELDPKIIGQFYIDPSSGEIIDNSSF